MGCRTTSDLASLEISSLYQKSVITSKKTLEEQNKFSDRERAIFSLLEGIMQKWKVSGHFESPQNIKCLFYCLGSCLKFKSCQIWREIQMDKSKSVQKASQCHVKAPVKIACFLALQFLPLLFSKTILSHVILKISNWQIASKERILLRLKS